jgi:hypothetical protein
MGARGGRREARRGSHARAPWWRHLSDAELLEVPIGRLGLRIEGTALAQRVARLEQELDRAGLRFRPYVWLSTDWFTPDGHTGFAVPFFLTHPRLARLERRHMLEVEGGARDWCMKLLRHETAHALDNAYRLSRRRSWREVFGLRSQPYRESYVPRPGSEHYVLNLDYWYAQSHPSEDFAETFSVWLQPGSRWRTRYQGWPALRKLEYVDALMAEIADAPPAVRTRARPDSVSQLRLTLRTYYRRKQARYADDHSFEYDEPLRRVFSAEGARGRRESAAGFLQRTRREIREGVAAVTGQHPYLIAQVLNELVLRCRRLGLRVGASERETLVQAAALVASLTMRFLRRGHPEYMR